jgi:hypothetical protein
MRTASRVFWMPKDPAHPGEYEDAFALDEARGAAAIADGVGSAIFSRQWADLLTQAVVARPPAVSEASFWDWIAEKRQAWKDSIDFSRLSFAQRGKLRQCGGAFTTLLWVEWSPCEGAPGWRAFATGDSGLLHVRGGQALQTFPVTTAAELKEDPLTIASVNLHKDHLLEFRTAEGVAEPCDLLVLCTDALLGWALTRAEAGNPIDWGWLWDRSEDDFRAWVQTLRDEDTIRVDDTTLILLRVLADEPATKDGDGNVPSLPDGLAQPAPDVGQLEPSGPADDRIVAQPTDLSAAEVARSEPGAPEETVANGELSGLENASDQRVPLAPTADPVTTEVPNAT